MSPLAHRRLPEFPPRKVPKRGLTSRPRPSRGATSKSLAAAMANPRVAIHSRDPGGRVYSEHPPPSFCHYRRACHPHASPRRLSTPRPVLGMARHARRPPTSIRPRGGSAISTARLPARRPAQRLSQRPPKRTPFRRSQLLAGHGHTSDIPSASVTSLLRGTRLPSLAGAVPRAPPNLAGAVPPASRPRAFR